MEEDKSKAESHPKPSPSDGSRYFWLGLLCGLLITAAIFHRFVFALARDAFTNVLPIVFSPGLLELTIAVVGFGIVIVVNHLLRKERDDEWVELPDDDD